MKVRKWNTCIGADMFNKLGEICVGLNICAFVPLLEGVGKSNYSATVEGI